MFALPSENKTVTSEKNMDALLYLPITTFPDKAEFSIHIHKPLLPLKRKEVCFYGRKDRNTGVCATGDGTSAGGRIIHAGEGALWEAEGL